MKEQFSRFDEAEFLTDETTIAHYLSAALDDANTDVFIAALSDVARARGITQMAKTAGVGRESLYKTLAPGSKPRYETIRKLLDTLGVKLMVVPGQAGTTAA
jgi:probable addiction module antidote protein